MHNCLRFFMSRLSRRSAALQKAMRSDCRSALLPTAPHLLQNPHFHRHCRKYSLCCQAYHPGWDRTSLRSESPYKLFLRTFPEAYDPANDTAFHSSSSAVSPHLYSYFCAFAFLFFIFFLRHIMIKYFYKEEGITVRDHSESHDQKQNKQRGLYLIRVYK